MKLFDFLIVPVYRSGGTAIQRFVSLHPQVVALAKSTLDGCLEDGSEMELLSAYQGFMEENPGVRVGLVQHRFIAEHGDLGETVERLSRIVRKDGLIMVFRNYFDAMISSINHRNIAIYCNYSFLSAGLPWFEKIDVTNSLELNDLAGERSEATDAADRIIPTPAYLQQFGYFRYAEIQETYQKHFSPVRVLDYDSILCRENRPSIRHLFRALNVKEDFYLPFFGVPQAGTGHRFLTHNSATLFSRDVPEIRVKLRPKTINEFSLMDHGVEVGKICDEYIRRLFGDELSLLAGTEVSEIGQQQIGTFLRSCFYPLWRRNFEAVSLVIDGFRVSGLSADEKSQMRDGLSEDSAHFFRMNPDLRRNWQESWGAHGPAAGTVRANKYG